MSATDSASLNLWEFLSLLGIVFVFVGVFMEGTEAFFWVRDWWRNRKPDTNWWKLPDPHVPKWAHVAGYWGWLILVFGLGLEWRGHVVVTDITNEENRRLTTQLEETTDKAGQAIEKAAKLDLARVELAKEVEVLGRANLVFAEQIITNAVSVAVLRTNLMSTGRNLSKMIFPLVMRNEHRADFLKASKDLPKGSLRITLGSRASNPAEYADEIRKLLLQAGYDAGDKLERMEDFLVPFTSIRIALRTNSTPPDFLIPLVRALGQSEINVSTTFIYRTQTNAVEMIVGDW